MGRKGNVSMEYLKRNRKRLRNILLLCCVCVLCYILIHIPGWNAKELPISAKMRYLTEEEFFSVLPEESLLRNLTFEDGMEIEYSGECKNVDSDELITFRITIHKDENCKILVSHIPDNFETASEYALRTNSEKAIVCGTTVYYPLIASEIAFMKDDEYYSVDYNEVAAEDTIADILFQLLGEGEAQARLIDKAALQSLEKEWESKDIAEWIDSELSYNYLKFFADYNENKTQRITGTADDNYSPAVCPDIIFYQADEGENPEGIVVRMTNLMMEPLMTPNDSRPFTITEYVIDEQELVSVGEDIWILPYINGYYSYEGSDFVSMKECLEAEPLLDKNDLIPFMRQGSAENFVYILIKDENVYRLERAYDMMEQYD